MDPLKETLEAKLNRDTIRNEVMSELSKVIQTLPADLQALINAEKIATAAYRVAAEKMS